MSLKQSKIYYRNVFLLLDQHVMKFWFLLYFFIEEKRRNKYNFVASIGGVIIITFFV